MRRNFPKPSLLFLVWLAAGIANGLLWLAAWLFFPHPAGVVALHYRSQLGIDFIGEAQSIFALPLAGLAVIVINVIVAMIAGRADRRLIWMVASAATAVQLTLLAALLFLRHVNI